MTASGDDLCYILVEALDQKDNLCPLADNLIRFNVDGPAEIAGVGNGNMNKATPKAMANKLLELAASVGDREAEARGHWSLCGHQ